jgi:hypothetical protein
MCYNNVLFVKFEHSNTNTSPSTTPIQPGHVVFSMIIQSAFRGLALR